MIIKLLVAEQGEMARRVVRAARAMGITTVAVFTEADRSAPAPREADEAVALERLSDRGAAAYLDTEALLAAARRAGADAVHPGGGALAADAAFAWRCAEAGLVYVGPSPEAIATLGPKLEAREVAAGAGVPVLATEEVDGYPPGKLEAVAEMLGWPVVARSSMPAGGAGPLVVEGPGDLLAAVETVRRSAGGGVFLEPWVGSARHIEVQVFGDAVGRVVPLFERDGSLGRRSGGGTLIGEAPAPRLPQPVREQLLASAVAVAEAVGYVGAGTAEFLVAGDRFWFCGMGTRLDTGHVLTEAVLGLDLVRTQLTVAEGRPLPVEARHCSPTGHAVSARLRAEQPATGAGPAGRRLRQFEIDPAPGLRVEAGVATGSLIPGGLGAPGGAVDRQAPAAPAGVLPLATVVSEGATRSEAVRRLAMALEGMRLHGVRTNRDRLVAALRHPGFLAREPDPGFLERHDALFSVPRAGPEALRLHAAAALLAGASTPAVRAAFQGPDGRRVEVRARLGPTGAVTGVEIDGEPLAGLVVGAVSPGAVDLEVDGVRRGFAVARSGPVIDVDSPLGHSELTVLEAAPGH